MSSRNVGERPAFFDDPAVDQLMALFMAMSGELSVLYDRVDTLERLLEESGVMSRERIEAYRPDSGVADQRQQRRQEYIRRLFRIIREDAEHLVPHDKMEAYKALQEELKNS